MSYDVYLDDGTGAITGDRNYTYNIAKMLRQVWDGSSMADMDGKPAPFVADSIDLAISAMTNDPERFDALAPDNRWGDRLGCINWLREIQHDCREFPYATVRVA